MQLAGIYEDVVTDTFINTIETAAPLCDIGNVAVPKEILQKKDVLTADERSRMQTHTTVGARILNDIALSSEYNDFVQMAADIANYHHENWDGSGYPAGKKGDDIPLSAQIVAVGNVYCALTADRVYRVSYTKEEALRIIGADVGEKFNPQIYTVYRKISKQLK
jgi:putative two-component system response regulator